MKSSQVNELSPLSCQSVRELLEIAEATMQFQSAISSHCAQCTACQRYARELTGLRSMLASQAHVPVPIDFNFKLRLRIAAHQQSPGGQAWWRWVQQPAFGVAAMLMVACGVWFYHSYQINQAGLPGSQGAVITNPTPSFAGGAKLTNDGGGNIAVNTGGTIGPSVQIDKPSSPVAVTVSSIGGRNNRHNLSVRMAGSNSVNVAALDNEIKFIDRSGNTRAVPVTMVVYGAQPVVSLDTIDPDDLDSSSASSEGSSIF